MPHPQALLGLSSLPSAQVPRASMTVTPQPASTGLDRRPGLLGAVNHCPQQPSQGGCKKLYRSQASFSFISCIPQALEHRADGAGRRGGLWDGGWPPEMLAGEWAHSCHALGFLKGVSWCLQP